MIRTKLAREVAAEFSAKYGPFLAVEQQALASLIDARILGPLQDRARDRHFDHTRSGWYDYCKICRNHLDRGCTCPEFAEAPAPDEAGGGEAGRG